jgi:RNA polymerase sigma-70 factor (ECF subfamily)
LGRFRRRHIFRIWRFSLLPWMGGGVRLQRVKVETEREAVAGHPSTVNAGRAAGRTDAGSIISALMATRSNDAWLSDLRADGAARESALADLGGIIRHGLPYALSRWVSPDDPLFTPLVEEVTQDTLVRVLDQLGTFEGRSLFTTWAQKIAVRIALTELRRKRWQDSSLDELIDSERPAAASLLADQEPGPDAIAERSDMIARVRRVLEEELTPKQREALILLGIQDVPLEEAARRMKTNRNALYKLLHDARLRLKRRLKAEGLTAQEVLAAFERP